MSGDIVPIVLFADTFWIFARSDKMLSDMLELWERILGQHGHHFPRGEVVWSTTVADNVPARVAPHETLLQRRGRDVAFKALDPLLRRMVAMLPTWSIVSHNSKKPSTPIKRSSAATRH